MFPDITQSREILHFPICSQCLKPFFFPSRVTFIKFCLLSLLLGSLFPSVSRPLMGSHSPMVKVKHGSGRVNGAAPIWLCCVKKQRRACQLSSPSPRHYRVVLRNAFAGAFPGLILNGLSSLHFLREISLLSGRAHGYEISSNVISLQFFFAFCFSSLLVVTCSWTAQHLVCSGSFPAPSSQGFTQLHIFALQRAIRPGMDPPDLPSSELVTAKHRRHGVVQTLITAPSSLKALGVCSLGNECVLLQANSTTMG